MPEATYIVRFADESARDAFVAALQRNDVLADLRHVSGKVLPDLILYGVPENQLEHLQGLAPTARFMRSFKHDLFNESGTACAAHDASEPSATQTATVDPASSAGSPQGRR